MAADAGGGRSGWTAIKVVLAVALGTALLAPPAYAEIVVSLAGPGAGSVESDKAGKSGNKIECSDIGGGAAGPNCAESFLAISGGYNTIALSATAEPGSYFAHWSGDDPYGGTFGPTCNEGAANPCTTLDLTDIAAVPEIHIAATFELLPDPPPVTTGNAPAGREAWLRRLEGTVNPDEFAVDSCYFEYGTTTEYGTKTQCVEPGASELDETSATPEPVSAETEPLEPETTYHYRLVASNIGGSSHGEDRTFSTGPAPVGSCPNELIRHEQGAATLLLPDCMALEMVSPPEKYGQYARYPSVSADG